MYNNFSSRVSSRIAAIERVAYFWHIYLNGDCAVKVRDADVARRFWRRLRTEELQKAGKTRRRR